MTAAKPMWQRARIIDGVPMWLTTLEVWVKCGPPPTMTVIDELIVQDSPILTFLRDSDDQVYIALAIDRDSTVTRWVHSPISKTQHTALLLGALAVRDAIIAPPKVRLVDYSNATDTPVHSWEVEPSAIPEPCLPEHDALLPASVRREYAATRHCTKCDWRGHEGEMRKAPSIMGPLYPAGCPNCPAENRPFGGREIESAEGFAVVEQPR